MPQVADFIEPSYDELTRDSGGRFGSGMTSKPPPSSRATARRRAFMV